MKPKTALAARFDRAAILRDAWARAREAAAYAAESVRLHIGAAMRTAWGAAKAALMTPALVLTKPTPVQLCLIEHIANLPPLKATSATPRVSPARLHPLGRIEANDRTSVRRRIGAAMRAAWGTAKSTLMAATPVTAKPAPVQLCLIEHIANLPPAKAAPAAPQVSSARLHLLGRIEANDRTMARLRHEIDRILVVGLGSGSVDAEYSRLDDLNACAIELKGELASLDADEAAAASCPDLSTEAGLKAVLVGRSSPLPLDGSKAIYTVTDITRWASSDGKLVRDYLRFELSGAVFNEAAGPVGLFIERTGGAPKHAALPMATKAGKAWWSYGKECVSGAQRWAADKMARCLLGALEA